MLTRLCFYVLSPKNIPPLLPLPHSRGWSWCLDDAPVKDQLSLNSVLPGVLYSAAHQCRLQYGSGSLLCDDMDVRLSHNKCIKTNPHKAIYGHFGLLTSPSLLSSTMPFCIIHFCPHFLFLLSLVLLFSSPTYF